jgi:polyhydroxyalkanoate synthase
VQGLVLLTAPLHFGPDISAFGPVTAAISDVQALTDTLGNVPGSFLNAMSLLASPQTFLWSRWLDLVRSASDVHALQTHLLVERWTLDELAVAKRFFEEVVEWLYREDRFMRGTLQLEGRRAAPDLIEAPLLMVMDARCDIVPPQAILPFQQAVRSVDRMLLWYPGDTGVSLQHVGMLVGRNAHRRLWPEIIYWIHAHGQASAKL